MGSSREELLLEFRTARAAQVASEIDSVADSSRGLAESAQGVGDSADDAASGVANLADANDGLAESADAAAGSADDAAESTDTLGDSTQQVGQAAEDTAGKTQQLGEATQQTGDQAEQTAQKTNDLADAHERAATAAAGGSAAQSKIAQALTRARRGMITTAAAVGFLSLTLGAGKAQMASTTQVTNTFGVRGGARIQQFAKTAANSLGLSRTEAQRASVQFGTLLTGFDIGKRKSSVMSREFVRLSADIAKFRGASRDEVQDALWSGLAGKGNALKRFGIVLDQESIKHEAMRRGLVRTTTALTASGKAAAAKAKVSVDAYTKSLLLPANRQKALHDGLIKTTTKALTPQAKAMASYGLIMKKTTDMQGAWSRSQGKAATETAKAKATIANARAEIGTRLIPVYNRAVIATAHLAVGAIKAANGVGSVLRVIRQLAPLIAGITVALVALNAQAIAGNIAFGAFAVRYYIVTTAARAYAAAQWLVNAALTANPIGLVVAGLAVLVGAFIYAYKHSETFRRAVQGVWQWIKDHWPLLLGIITGGIGPAIVWVIRHWDQMRGAVISAAQAISHAASGMWNGMKSGLASAINYVIAKLNFFIDAYNGTIGKLGGHLGVPDLKIAPIGEVGLATGGTVTQSGWAKVGERGPELVKLPQGSTVYDAGQTAAAEQGDQARGMAMRFRFRDDFGGASTPELRALAALFRRMVEVEAAHG